MANLGKLVLWVSSVVATSFLMYAYKETLWGFQYWPFFMGMLVSWLALQAFFRD